MKARKLASIDLHEAADSSLWCVVDHGSGKRTPLTRIDPRYAVALLQAIQAVLAEDLADSIAAHEADPRTFVP